MAYIKCADDKWYDSESAPDYGNWYCTENDNGVLTLNGDSDSNISKLPTNIPYGSLAFTNDGKMYRFNKDGGWTAL